MLAPHRLPCDTPAAHRHGSRRAASARWVLPATILGSSLSYVDESVVNVALPAIQRYLGTSLATMQWVFNGYLLTLASLILLGGAASDRFGCRRLFLIGVAGFAVASVACALAPSPASLIAARFAQGTAAALLMPASLALIGAAYTGDARARAIGTWAAAGAIAIALGRPLGGWLVDAFGWRAVFLVNLPLAALALLFGWRLAIGRDLPQAGAPLDLRGAALAVLTLGLASWGLIAAGEGQRAGFVALAAAVPAAWWFIRTEVRASAPMLPLALFRHRDFAGANGLTVFFYAALSAAFFLLPFLLIDVHGYSAAAAGAAFLPLSVIMGLGSRRTGAIVERFGARALLTWGPALAALGYAMLGLSATDANYWRGLLPGLVVVGVGLTLTVTPLTTVVLDAAPDDKGGTAAGINNAADVAGGLIAVAALGLAFGGAGAGVGASASAGGMAGDALVAAYRVVMFASAALALLAAATAALTIGRGKE